MARRRRRLPPRGRKGRFLKSGSRRRRRRNMPTTYAASNPPRRRRRATRRRRAARRNPSFRGFKLARGFVFPELPRIAAGMAGVVASRTLPGYISKLIPLPNPWIGTALQAVTAVIGGQIVGRFTKRQLGEDFALCGLVMVADDLAQMFVYPNIGLGAYVSDPTMVGAYLDQYLSPGAIPGQLSPAGGADYGAAGLPSRLSSSSRL